MIDYEIQCSVFLFEWVVALFSNILSLDFSSRIWDSYFVYGDFYLMKVCLAISSCVSKQVDEENYEMLIMMFKSIDKSVTEETLFKAIDDNKLTEKQYEQVRRAVESTPDLERLI